MVSEETYRIIKSMRLNILREKCYNGCIFHGRGEHRRDDGKVTSGTTKAYDFCKKTDMHLEQMVGTLLSDKGIFEDINICPYHKKE